MAHVWSRYIWQVPLRGLSVIAGILTFGIYWAVEHCCHIKNQNAAHRRRKLRDATMLFLRTRAKKLENRNRSAGNVAESMRFYAKYNIPLAELAAMLEHELFRPLSAWRLDQRLYRYLFPTLGFGQTQFDQTDREMLCTLH